jgi:two-component system alkaline phosphatase synthesis response regulator PhoP
MLRRQQRILDHGVATVLQVGRLRLDVARHEVTVDGASLDLTRTEFSLLQTLMQNPGYVFTRSELIEKALGHSYESIERSLDTHIKNLRRKVGDDPKDPAYIQTIYGVGYRLVAS